MQSVKSLAISLIAGALWFGQSRDLPDTLYDSNGQPVAAVQSISSLLYFLAIVMALYGSTVIGSFYTLKATFLREQMAGAVAPLPFAFSCFLVPGIFAFVYALFLQVPLWFMVGFVSGGGSFIYMLVVLWLGMYGAGLAAIAISSLIESVQTAFALYPLFFVFSTQFAGYGMGIDSLPNIWYWAPYVSLTRWVWQGLMWNMWVREHIQEGDAVIEQWQLTSTLYGKIVSKCILSCVNTRLHSHSFILVVVLVMLW